MTRRQKLYRDAAAQMELTPSQLYSCNVVLELSDADEVSRYREVMGFPPEGISGSDPFLTEVLLAESDPRGLRVMLLSMMAAACEDVD